MKLLTKEISRRLQAQYPRGADLAQEIVCKFFDPCSQWTWYVMNQDPEDPDYLWGVVRGNEVEVGSFSLSELTAFKGKLGIGIERDLHFNPLPAVEVYEGLLNGRHF